MPNLLLTTLCNRSCPYCFALDAAGDGGPRAVTFREVVDLADRLLAAGERHVGLLGGEPTLHPDFPEIAAYLLRRGLSLTVFTNALLADGRADDLEGRLGLAAAPRERLLFVVNANPPEVDPPETRRRQVAFLRRFPRNCDLGVTVFRPDLDLSYLLDLAREAGLEQAGIRVGLAQPIAGATNAFLPLDAYREASARIVALAEGAAPRRIRLTFDCGFLLCAFTDLQLGTLYRLGARLRFACHPAVDIAPGGDAWACFPLARRTRTAVPAGEGPRALAERLSAATEAERARRAPGVLAACADCVHRGAGQCDGGCLAHLLRA